MSDGDKFNHLCSVPYKEQATWFLNAYWDEGAKNDAEKMWSWVQKMQLLDPKKGEGNALDELNAHRFLEQLQETLTVQDLREKLRQAGVVLQDNRLKSMPLVHYLIFKFKLDWKKLVNAPQGSKEDIDKAARMLAEVNAAFADAHAKDEVATKSLKHSTEREHEAKSAESEAKAREADAKAREADAKAKESEAQHAQSELEAALKELKAQEESYAKRTAELKKASEEGGAVSRNKAANELAQHLGQDPLPLRKAKITQEAAVKKAERATKAAQDSAAQASSSRQAAEHAAECATNSRNEAEEARRASEAAKASAEAALNAAQRSVDQATVFLEDAKKRLPFGATWWLERELHEARAYLPASKGGYKK